MPDLATLKSALLAKFPFLADDKFVLQRERRMYLDVPAEKHHEVAAWLKEEQKFRQCCTITGTDDKETLAALYHLAHDDGTLCNLRQRVPREKPVIQSVCDLFPACANYERELTDLLGFQVKDLPPGKRYPMPDDFPRDQHPLRKDWKPTT